MKETEGKKQFAFFNKKDLIVYAILIAIIFSLFLSFVILPKKQVADGFVIYYKNETVATFNYNDSSFTISPSSPLKAEIQGVENGFLITVFLDETGKEYNTLFSSPENKTVKMKDSTCSVKKDCVYSAEISSVGAIICSPHHLKIIPLGHEYIPVVVG